MNDRTTTARSAWLVAAAVLGVGFYGFGFNAQYPIREWFLVRVLGYWLLALYWSGGCLAFGLAVVRWVTPRQYRPSELPFVAFPLGILAFGLLMFAASLAGAIGRPLFYAAPLLLGVVGFRASKHFIARLGETAVSRVRSFDRLDLLAFAFGAVGLVLVYVPILTPHNLQHDARWYHIPIAQQYVAEGALPRFSEGWFLAAYPHLTSLVYAWALLLPASVVHRLELAAHLEFVIFLFTIASVPSVVRRLLPGVRIPAAWVGFFLFPGFLVYDATLSVGADHVAAVWAPGGLLVLLAAMRTSSPRHAALVGALAAGAAWTKYSALSVALPLVGVLLVCSAMRASNPAQKTRAISAAIAGAATFAAFWAPHWMKNWVLFGDPVYPHGSRHFHPHPWNVETAIYVRIFLRNAILAPSPGWKGIWESLRAALTVGFDVNEYNFHGGIPTFGFLFAVTAYALPWLRPPRRVFLAYGVGFAAVLVWYWTNHRDRYLQACLPWLVVATVASLAVAFRERGLTGRLVASGLVVTQVAFGAGNFLMPAHQMAPEGHALPHLLKIEQAAIEKRYDARFAPHEEWGFADWTALGRLLPPKSRVLVHEDRLWVGLDAPVVVDEAGWQGGIRYAAMVTTPEVYDVLAAHGVTHIVTGVNHGDGGDHGLGGNLVFWEFLSRNAMPIGKQGKLVLWRMPDKRPEPRALGDVLVLSCNLSRPLGVYSFADVQRKSPKHPLDAFSEAPPALFEQVSYVVYEDGCEGPLDERIRDDMEVMTTRGRVTFYRRERGDSAR